MFGNRPRAVTVAALSLAALATAAVVPAGAGAAPAPRAGIAPAGLLPPMGQTRAVAHAAASAAAPLSVTAPLTPSQCQAEFGTPCYDAGMLRKVYGTAGMREEGQDATVALILPYHNPVLRHDLDVYAREAGLPVPDLHVITIGHPVTASTSDFEQTIASQEGTLDAEMVLAMAPRVRLDYIETQADPALSPSAFSSAANVLATTVTRLRPAVDAVSFSYGAFEANYAEQAGSTTAGNAVIRQQAAAVDDAVKAGITVMAADGDTGAAGPNLAGTGVHPDPTVAFPADDPLVTAVSGSRVIAGDDGTRTAPDTVWTDDGDGGATGGGLSLVFARPSWQDPYAAITGRDRGVGDVAMDGASETPVWMYTSRYNVFSDQALGWVRVAGTSAASPMFTGLVALAASKAGHPFGAINPSLYAMARHDAVGGLQPIVTGCNTDDGVQGYCAGPGPWSLPDGIGTVRDAARFVPALAAATSRS